MSDILDRVTSALPAEEDVPEQVRHAVRNRLLDTSRRGRAKESRRWLVPAVAAAGVVVIAAGITAGRIGLRPVDPARPTPSAQVSALPLVPLDSTQQRVYPSACTALRGAPVPGATVVTAVKVATGEEYALVVADKEMLLCVRPVPTSGQWILASW
jgi:hypothetical protein